jgi:ATP phosphoribosyltransferase regulatory subunit
MGIISALVDEVGLSAKGKEALISCIGEKNIHGIEAICKSEGKNAETVKKLVSMKGGVDEMLEILKDTSSYSDALELAEILSAVGGKARVDFSVTDDMNYYSGIVFKGFINGIPTDVLTGGRLSIKPEMKNASS